MSTDADSPALRPTTPDPRPPLPRTSSSLSGLARRGADRVGDEFGESLVLLGMLAYITPNAILTDRCYRDILRYVGTRIAECSTSDSDTNLATATQLAPTLMIPCHWPISRY